MMLSESSFGFPIRFAIFSISFSFSLNFDYKNRKNTFFYLHEVKYRGSPENSKPDFTLFINGIPVIVIEAKSEIIPSSHSIALNQIRRYDMFSPDLFRFVQFGVAYGEDKLYTPTMPNWRREVRDLPLSTGL